MRLTKPQAELLTEICGPTPDGGLHIDMYRRYGRTVTALENRRLITSTCVHGDVYFFAPTRAGRDWVVTER